MCGIYGSTRIYSNDIIRKKLDRIAFRGPDYSAWVNLDDQVVLGHNRLSIIDLDARSNQPFQYEHVLIVFNGEIFNYKSIRKDLANIGYRFTTTSDTEVICAAYLAYGEECVQHFNGMFSFVIYDKQKQILYGARDRVGKKPFYYSLRDGHFEFASQISAIAIGSVTQVSEVALNKYLLRGYIEDPYSIYEGINKLKAGYAFRYDLNKKEFKQSPYWDIELSPTILNISYDEAKERLESLLLDAVDIRMIADVSVGTFLSGGIDSSLVTALAAIQSGGKVNAFSIKFNENGFDESDFAKEIAEHLGISHTIVPCDYHEGIDIISELNRYYDEPFADSSAVPSILLARQTRKYMTVALSGDGGDEIFLGYRRYEWIKKTSRLFKAPYLIRRLAASLLDVSPVDKHRLIAGYIKKKDINDLINDTLTSFYSKKILLKEDTSTQYQYVFSNSNIRPELVASNLDFKLYLNNDCLVKVDRATMSASMEARTPLLDYRIVEFGRSMPLNYKFKDNVQKRILKDILYEYVPKNLMDRPKSGFTMPFSEWFRKELKEYVYDTITDQNLKMIPGLNIPFIKDAIDRHMRREINFYSEIWRFIVLINWMKENRGCI